MFLGTLFTRLNICSNYKKLSSTATSTIFAHSSGQGKCGVSIIRVSGGEAGSVLKKIAKLDQLPKPRYAILKNITNPHNGEILDKGLLLWFPAPNSFTGEDCCELQIHGSIAVIKAVLNMLGTFDNLRLAKPGEFTKRAFVNGKLTLTEVEGLADLLLAETEVQRKQAFLQSQGSLNKLYNNWSEILRRNLAHFEAYIDFDETDTIDHNLLTRIYQDTQALTNEISTHLKDGRKGERLRNGVKTVIVGNTNVGKSSLFNALCQRPAAIVTPVEGTTRDILEVMLDIAGYPLILIDTAGLRQNATDIVEQEGINRALVCYEEADLILLVIDSLSYQSFIMNHPTKTSDNFVKHYVQKLGLSNFFDHDDSLKKSCIVIINKTDLTNDKFPDKFVCISCKTEDGFENLLLRIEEKLRDLCGEPTQEHPCMNQARHKQSLIGCLKNLEIFLHKQDEDAAIHAEYLRRALHHLGTLTGKVTTEQILDVIFRDFCIGK